MRAGNRCRSALAGAIAVVLAGPAAAQDVDIPLSLNPGERYEMTIIAETARDPEVPETLMDRAVTPVAMDVLDRSETGYTLRWTMGLTEISTAEESSEAALAQVMAKSAEGMVIEFEADPSLLPVRLLNGDAIRTAMRDGIKAAAEEILQQGEAHGMPGFLVKLMSMQIRHLADQYTDFSDERLMAQMLDKAALLAIGHNVALSKGDSQTYESVEPNPLTETPVPVRGTLELADVAADSGDPSIRWWQSYDTIIMTEQAYGLTPEVKARLREKGVDPNELDPDQYPPVEIEERAEAVIDARNGLTRNVAYERIISARTFRKFERQVVTVEKAL